MLRPTRRASVPTSEVSCAISQARCSRGALPSRANVAAAERSWSCVGSLLTGALLTGALLAGLGARVASPGPDGVGAFSMIQVRIVRSG